MPEDSVKPSEVKLEDFFTKMLSVIGQVTDDQIASLLKERHKTLSVAESVTGGMVTERLTNVSGSSEYFLGGMVAYHNRIKVQELGVSAAVISKEGPVSKEVAVAMAEGIRRRFRTDLGLATTGCAGPLPSQPAPVGLAFIALASNQGTDCRELNLQGTRKQIREKVAQAALGLLWLNLGGEEDRG